MCSTFPDLLYRFNGALPDFQKHLWVPKILTAFFFSVALGKLMYHSMVVIQLGDAAVKKADIKLYRGCPFVTLFKKRNGDLTF